MRRGLIGLAIIGTLTGGAQAVPQGELATAVALRYLPEVVTLEVGTALDFLNADPASLTDGHDITHDAPGAERRFASATILIGSVTPVTGVAELDVGLYRFFCTRHPFMTGTLEVIVTASR